MERRVNDEGKTRHSNENMQSKVTEQSNQNQVPTLRQNKLKCLLFPDQNKNKFSVK